jgi:hypothetical protein
MLRNPHCLDNRLTDGGNVVSPAHRPRSTPEKRYFSASGVHLCRRMSEPQGLVRPEVLRKLKKFIHLIGSRTRELPTCSIVLQPLRYCVPHVTMVITQSSRPSRIISVPEFINIFVRAIVGLLPVRSIGYRVEGQSLSFGNVKGFCFVLHSVQTVSGSHPTSHAMSLV